MGKPLSRGCGQFSVVRTRTATSVLRPRVQGGQCLRAVEATEGSVPMWTRCPEAPGVGEWDCSTGQGSWVGARAGTNGVSGGRARSARLCECP